MDNQLSVVKASSLDFTGLNIVKGLITPSVAAELLERNFDDNRNVASNVMRRYSRLMKDGQWKLSDPIKFSSDGVLIDGQHRLNAVIDSGIASPFVIITGLPKESCEVLDQGKKRDVADILKFRSVSMSYSREVVSVMRAVLDATTGRKYLMSPSEVATLIEHFSEGLTFSYSYAKQKNSIRYAPVIAVAFMAYYSENHERLDDFLYCWHNGTVRHGAEDNAAILLRNTYLTRKSTKDGSGERRSFFNKAQSALQYFLKGECPKHFREIERVVWGADFFSRENLKKIIESKKSSNNNQSS